MHLSLSGRQWLQRGEIAPVATAQQLPELLVRSRNLQPTPLLSGTQFSDFDRLVARLQQAIGHREKIGIVGDYDCDGVTSTALWVRALRRRGVEPIVRLPHRIRDGYGIKPGHIDDMAAAGVTLLLSVDTGVTAFDAAALAKKRGIDLCIVDHHHAPSMPDAYAIIHQDRAEGITAPPSAATLSFAVINTWEGGSWSDRNTDIALAAIGTIADVMPLIGSNRTLVEHGLIAINALQSGALKELLTLSNVQQCTARDIAFGLAPRINAAGRMDDPTIALDAVLDGGDALHALCRLNGDRQLQVEEHLEEVLRAFDLSNLASLPAFLFAVSDRFSPGTVGLLAGKLTERTGRPSLVGAIQGATVTASLRSPACYHVAEGLGRVATLLQHFGGHAQAAGCSFALEHSGALQRALLADVTVQVTADRLHPTHSYDAVLQSPGGISLPLIEELSALEPFGSGNPEPRIVLPKMHLTDIRKIGSDLTHLQSRIGGIAAVGFGLGHLLEFTAQPVDVLCRLSRNTWNGRSTPQLMMEDLRIAE